MKFALHNEIVALRTLHKRTRGSKYKIGRAIHPLHLLFARLAGT